MAKETFTGPILVLGGLAGGPSGGQPREYSDEIGPSLFWGGYGIPATGAVASKDKTGPGTIPCITGASPIKTVSVPVTPGAAALTTAANAVAGTPLPNLTTYNAGRAPVPALVGGQTVNAIALDMGIDTATFQTAGTVTLAVAANAWRYSRPGMWLALLNGGVAGACFFTQVRSVNLATGVITVSPAPTSANNATGQISFTSRFNPNSYGFPAPTGVSGEAPAGSARISIPEMGNGRGVGVTGVAGGTGGPVLIQGVDVFGAPTSEIIVAGAGAGTTWGKKTYDVFISATPQFTNAANYTVVTSDLIGLPITLLGPSGLYAVIFGATTEPAADYTIVPGDLTFPATQTTGDPRGGIQVTANGPAAAPGTPLVLDGTTVLQIWQILDPLQVALATTTNPGPLLGVPSV
jgi:hypothetical protein